jgi:hypothetical protein
VAGRVITITKRSPKKSATVRVRVKPMDMETIVSKINEVEQVTLYSIVKELHERIDSGGSPLVPEKFGNLRGSYYIITKGNKKAARVREGSTTDFSIPGGGSRGGTTYRKKLARLERDHPKAISKAISKMSLRPSTAQATLGYSAFYASITDENYTAVNWTRPGSGPRWWGINYQAILSDLRNRLDILLKETL